jgi:hypothetical protein
MKQIDIRADTMKLAMDQLRSIGSQLYNKQHSGVYTSADIANQVSTGDWGNSHASGAGQHRDQTAQTTNKRSTVICTGSLYLNGNFAGLYDYAYISGNITTDAVDEMNAFDHWFTGNQDTHWALVCVDGTFTQGRRSIIKPPVRKLGFVLNVDGAYTLNGITSMTNRGANHSGTGDSHGYTAPVAIPVNGSITIPATGGAGGAGADNTSIGHSNGSNGGTATNGSGGGGGGSVSIHGSVTRGISGNGAAGTCFTGGPGGGGFMMLHAGSTLATDSDEFMHAIPNGGAGGNPPISIGGNYAGMGGNGNPGCLHRGTGGLTLNSFGLGGSGNTSPTEATYYGFGESVDIEDKRSSSLGGAYYLARPYSSYDNSLSGLPGTLIILVNGAYTGTGHATSVGIGGANIHDGFGGGAGGSAGGGVVCVLDDNGSGGPTSKASAGVGTNAYTGGTGGAGSAIRGTYG